MLLFVDELRHIRIVRQSESGGVREPIGRIRKHDSEIPDEVRSQLDGEELAEVEATLAMLAAGEKARLTAEIALLPARMRDVLDYYRHDANALEQRWIRNALQEAIRVLRRHERLAAETAAD